MRAEERLMAIHRAAKQAPEMQVGLSLDIAQRAIALLRRVSNEGVDGPVGWNITGELYWAIEKYLEGGDEA